MEWKPQVGDVIKWSAESLAKNREWCHPLDRMVVTSLGGNYSNDALSFQYLQRMNSLPEEHIRTRTSLGCINSPHSFSWFVIDPFLTAARRAVKK